MFVSIKCEDYKNKNNICHICKLHVFKKKSNLETGAVFRDQYIFHQKCFFSTSHPPSSYFAPIKRVKLDLHDLNTFKSVKDVIPRYLIDYNSYKCGNNRIRYFDDNKFNFILKNTYLPLNENNIKEFKTLEIREELKEISCDVLINKLYFDIVKKLNYYDFESIYYPDKDKFYFYPNPKIVSVNGDILDLIFYFMYVCSLCYWNKEDKFIETFDGNGMMFVKLYEFFFNVECGNLVYSSMLLASIKTFYFMFVQSFIHNLNSRLFDEINSHVKCNFKKFKNETCKYVLETNNDIYDKNILNIIDNYLIR